MSDRPPTRTDWIVVLLIFGGFLAYCLVGAVRGDLYWGGKFHPGVHLHGWAAWRMALGIALIGAGVVARLLGQGYVRHRRHTTAEFLFIGAGIAVIWLPPLMTCKC
jgi:hypothetical protein